MCACVSELCACVSELCACVREMCACVREMCGVMRFTVAALSVALHWPSQISSLCACA